MHAMPCGPPSIAAAADGPLRLFVALWPEPPLRQALAAWAAPWVGAGRPVAASQLHLTLHFLGSVPQSQLPALRHALHVPAVPCSLQIGGCAHWRDLLVALPLQLPPELGERHARLGEALQVLGLPRESRAWRPHITLARRHTGPLPPPLATPLVWPVRSHVLVVSAGGYRVLASFGPSRRG